MLGDQADDPGDLLFLDLFLHGIAQREQGFGIQLGRLGVGGEFQLARFLGDRWTGESKSQEEAAGSHLEGRKVE